MQIGTICIWTEENLQHKIKSENRPSRLFIQKLNAFGAWQTISLDYPLLSQFAVQKKRHCAHTVILSHRTLKKWGLSNFAF